MKLAPDSQELTTFRTPFGRYCFQRLAFGLNVSQDLYQQHKDRIIEQCEGCVGISDDVTIYGSTEAEHDQRLIAFFKEARKEGLMLNSHENALLRQTVYRSLAEYIQKMACFLIRQRSRTFCKCLHPRIRMTSSGLLA